MSVPPFVCSTPPPPDQVEEDDYNDEFSFNYEDSSSLSPTHQYEPGEYPTYNSAALKDTSTSYFSSSTEIKSTIEDTTTSDPTSVNSAVLNVTGFSDIPDVSPQSEKNLPIDTETRARSKECVPATNTIEESNIEDLDLKLESLQIDFENERVSVEESLNSTFDDFGTFLSTSELNESLYLSKETDNHDTASEKETKSQETCSEDSTSLPNDDLNSDFEVGWDQFNHPFKGQSEVQPVVSIVNSVCDKVDEITNGISNNESSLSKITQSDYTTDNIINDSSLEEIINTNDEINTDKQSDVHFKTNYSNEAILDESKCPQSVVYNNDNLANDDTNILRVPEETQNTIVIQNELANVEEISEFTKFQKDTCGTCMQNTAENIPHSINLETSHSPNASFEDEFDDFATFHNTQQTEIRNGVLETTFSNPAVEFEVNFQAFADNENSMDLEKDVASSNLNERIAPLEDDDDFGDFDTYDPSNMAESQSQLISDVASKQPDSLEITDLIHSDDSEIIEILNKAISTIYPGDAVSEHENNLTEDSHELKAVLGDSWARLRAYEAEQSYLFVWNNSASQKSLLKSLGIDSRNILFGQKWNNNMPRFAANLGANPLQPIKQTLTTSSSDCRVEEKSSSNTEIYANASQKSINDWESTENFSMGDNQASSYAESLLLDLEHLMATLDQMTSGQSTHFKISDLFTTACNERSEEEGVKPQVSVDSGSKEETLQPPSLLNIGRKINLPDTHIFTPTDSETPWSHTIHYNDRNINYSKNLAGKDLADNFSLGSTNMDGETNSIDNIDDFDDFQSHEKFEDSKNVPETPCDSILLQKANTNIKTSISLDEIVSNTFVSPENNLDKFDDFGDFHSAIIEEQTVSHSKILPPVGVLEPVKLSPSIPVVNWPAPGEITATVFGDFPERNEPTISTMSKENSVQLPPMNIFPSGPVSFILKESKIDAETCAVEAAKPKTSVQTENLGMFDDFSDFQSVTKKPYANKPLSQMNLKDTLITTRTISNNISESVFSNNVDLPNDEFEDFQSVEFNPVYVNSLEKTSSKVLSKPTTSQTHDSPIPEFLRNPPIQEFSFSTNTFAKPFLDPVQIQRVDELASKNTSQQILQPLSLENYSQINWPDPGIDLQDLSRFNPINSIQSYSEPKTVSKSNNSHTSVEDDGWSDFVSIKPNNQTSNHYFAQPLGNYNPASSNFISSQTADDSEDWSDFVSGTVLPSRNSNEVKTISQNIHSQSGNSASPYYKNSSQSLTNPSLKAQQPPPISAPNINVLPHLSYVSPKPNTNRFNNSHFKNL